MGRRRETELCFEVWKKGTGGKRVCYVKGKGGEENREREGRETVKRGRGKR